MKLASLYSKNTQNFLYTNFSRLNSNQLAKGRNQIRNYMQCIVSMQKKYTNRVINQIKPKIHILVLFNKTGKHLNLSNCCISDRNKH